MKKILAFVLLVVLLVTLAACAPGSKVKLDKSDTEMQFTTPGPNPERDKPAESGLIAGLAMGFWHGLISPVTLIMSFLNPVIPLVSANIKRGFLFLEHLLPFAPDVLWVNEQ